jgi:MoxR-like ATPase
MHAIRGSLEDANPSLKQFNSAHQDLQRVLDEMDKVLVGQREVGKLVLAGILAGGNVMITGMPGLGKTELLSNLSRIIGLDYARIQCTPDLMPSDIIGTEVFNKEENKYEFLKGPLFHDLVLGDEINRAPPKIQSAFLEAMQEKQVTINGATYPLSKNFHLVATRNPIEQEGTYPLPEAQMDRFMFDIKMHNLSEEDELKALDMIDMDEDRTRIRNIITKEKLLDFKKLAETIPVGDDLKLMIIRCVRACRKDSENSIQGGENLIAYDPSGLRAPITFIRAARALALIEGKHTPGIDQIKSLALPILAHRMSLTFSARAQGHSFEKLINRAFDRELGL